MVTLQKEEKPPNLRKSHFVGQYGSKYWQLGGTLLSAIFLKSCFLLNGSWFATGTDQHWITTSQKAKRSTRWTGLTSHINLSLTEASLSLLNTLTQWQQQNSQHPLSFFFFFLPSNPMFSFIFKGIFGPDLFLFYVTIQTIHIRWKKNTVNTRQTVCI